MSDDLKANITQARDAFQIAALGTSETPAFEGTRDEWIASLKGEKGDKGDKGEDADLLSDGTGLTQPAQWRGLMGLGALAIKDGLTKAEVGLGSVDDTSDASKPISTAAAAAFAAANTAIGLRKIKFEANSIAALKTLSLASVQNGEAAAVTGFSALGDGGGGHFYYDPASAVADDGGTVIAPASGVGRWVRIRDKGVFHVNWFGAKGDGVTNDTAAINLATESAYRLGGGVVYFAPSTYVIRRRNAGSQAASIRVRAGVSIDFNGATCLLTDNCTFIGNDPDTTTRATITANSAAGATQFTVDSTAALVAGDVVGVRLGNNTYDTVETCQFFIASIKSIDSATLLTLDRPAMESMTVASTTALNRRIIRFRASDGNALYENQFIKNVKIIQGSGGNAESGMWFSITRNILIENVYAENPGSGVVMMSYGFNNTTRNVFCRKSIRQSGQGSKGRVLNLWNCENCLFQNIKGEEIQGNFAFVESYCKGIVFEQIEYRDSWVAANGTARENSAFSIVQESQVAINGCRVTGSGASLEFTNQGGTLSFISFTNLELDTVTKITEIQLSQWAGGFLKLEGSFMHFSQVKRVTHFLRFSSNMSDLTPSSVRPPVGFILGAWYRATSIAGMQTCFIVTPSGNTPFAITVAGALTPLSGSGAYGASYPINVKGDRSYRLYSTTVSGDGFLEMTYLIAPYQVDDKHLPGQSVSPSSFEAAASGGSLYLRSPNGTRYRLTIADGGAVTTVATP